MKRTGYTNLEALICHQSILRLQECNARQGTWFGNENPQSERREGKLLGIDKGTNGVNSRLVGVEMKLCACRVGDENPRVGLEPDQHIIPQRNGVVEHIEEPNAKGATGSGQQRMWKPLDGGFPQIQISRKHADTANTWHSRNCHPIDGNNEVVDVRRHQLKAYKEGGLAGQGRVARVATRHPRGVGVLTDDRYLDTSIELVHSQQRIEFGRNPCAEDEGTSRLRNAIRECRRRNPEVACIGYKGAE